MAVGRLTGTFDLVGIDDLDVLRQAGELCSELVVEVHTDKQVEALEGRRPVVPLDERLRQVAHVRGVQSVIVCERVDTLGCDGRSTFAFRGRDGRVVLVPRATGVAQPFTRSGALDADGSTAGYVPGAWDMFHIGHLNILERARERCDRLIVGVVTDEALFAAKGKQPMVPFAARAQVVASIDLVDQVVADHSSSKLQAWQQVGFDVIFKGTDWQGTPKGFALEAEMASVGVRVCYFPYTAHTSSTALRSILAAR